MIGRRERIERTDPKEQICLPELWAAAAVRPAGLVHYRFSHLPEPKHIL